MFAIDALHKAHSAQEAVHLLVHHPTSRLIAGGTDVLVKLRELDARFHCLVDIHDLPELTTLEVMPSGVLRIGSGCTFTQLAESVHVCTELRALAEAAEAVAGPQIRNVGTLGGNLCNGAVSADTAAPVLALGGVLRILGSEGERCVDASTFHTGPGRVALERHEVLLSVDFPADRKQWQSSYTKYAMREAMDIATIGCAVALKLFQDGKNRHIEDARVALSVAAPTPLRCTHTEIAAKGNILNETTLKAMAEAIMDDVTPRDSWRASKAFRLHIIRTLIKRVTIAAASKELQA